MKSEAEMKKCNCGDTAIIFMDRYGDPLPFPMCPECFAFHDSWQEYENESKRPPNCGDRDCWECNPPNETNE